VQVPAEGVQVPAEGVQVPVAGASQGESSDSRE